MKIDFRKMANDDREGSKLREKPDFLYLCILEAWSKNEFDIGKYPECQKRAESLDVTMTVEGKEIDINRFFERIKSEYYSSIERRAEELLKEKIAEKTQPIYDMLDDMERNLREKCSEYLTKEDKN